MGVHIGFPVDHLVELEEDARGAVAVAVLRGVGGAGGAEVFQLQVAHLLRPWLGPHCVAALEVRGLFINQYNGWLVNHPSYEWSATRCLICTSKSSTYVFVITPHYLHIKLRVPTNPPPRFSVFTHTSPPLSTYYLEQSMYFATHRYFSSAYPHHSPYMSTK